jgi:molecular chaperone GrpE
LNENAETVNVQNEEPTLDTAASAAEPVEEQEAVEAADKASAGETLEPESEPEPTPEEALAQAEAQAQEYLDGWQRARAEFANYRRREEQRRKQSVADIASRVLGRFLPVLDDLERALASVPPEVRDNPWVEGLSMVAQKMLSGMEKEGVAVMPVELGDAFDPNLHMAVLHLPCDDYDEGQISMVLQRGYTIGERVLRPAMVQVSSGRECAADDDAAGEPTEEPEKEIID